MPRYRIEATVWSDEPDAEKFGEHVEDVLWVHFDDVLPPGPSVYEVNP